MSPDTAMIRASQRFADDTAFDDDDIEALTQAMALSPIPARDGQQERTLPTPELVRQLLLNLGEDAEREGLLKTPARVAKALQFLTSGYDADLDEVLNDALFDSEGSEMVLVKEIEFHSMCEHHMLPIEGKAHVAYIPNGKVCGLSKIPRIVDVFARRLQLQERLTTQIAEALQEKLDAKGVAVIIQAKHFCMKMRGVEKQCSDTITSAYLGEFKEDRELRNEFLGMLRQTLSI